MWITSSVSSRVCVDPWAPGPKIILDKIKRICYTIFRKEVKYMTDFDIIRDALTRIGVEFKVTEWSSLNETVIEIEDSNSTTELHFHNGKLTDRFVWW
jgi:hypothetical protein